MKKLIMALGAALVFAAGSAFAGDSALTADTAKRFVASLPSVETLAESLEAEGRVEEMRFDTEPKAGEEFKPYSKAVMALKAKYPSDYGKLSSAVKPHGFTAEEWGVAGDKVMIAYMALKMDKEDPGAMAQMEAMDPAMLEMMPPEMKAQMERVKAMMATIAAASPEDKKAVAEVEDELDAYMDEQGAGQSTY
ncbi:hypothetical protein [Hyphococcus sp.]|uniref:hypothetical protein n=1 Tax=Hyphococcus sp. TaxID=2038636 RepID=UPI0035C78307